MCRERVDARGGGRLERVSVAVGELSAVEPDLLAFAWEAVTAGGPDAGAPLEIEWRRARCRCTACGELAGRAAGQWPASCPGCGGRLTVEGGHDLDLLRFEYAPAGAPAEAAR
jgi:hydrogenase nickel insertion protein HypA